MKPSIMAGGRVANRDIARLGARCPKRRRKEYEKKPPGQAAFFCAELRNYFLQPFFAGAFLVSFLASSFTSSFLAFLSSTLRATLRAGAALKLTVLEALILMGSFVRGLRPSRSARSLIVKVPKPGYEKRAPVQIASLRDSKTASTISDVCFFVRPSTFQETQESNSALVIVRISNKKGVLDDITRLRMSKWRLVMNSPC